MKSVLVSRASFFISIYSFCLCYGELLPCLAKLDFVVLILNPSKSSFFSVHGRHLQLHENEKDLSGYEESFVGLAKLKHSTPESLVWILGQTGWCMMSLLAHPSNDRRSQTHTLTKLANMHVYFLGKLFFFFFFFHCLCLLNKKREKFSHSICISTWKSLHWEL